MEKANKKEYRSTQAYAEYYRWILLIHAADDFKDSRFFYLKTSLDLTLSSHFALSAQVTWHILFIKNSPQLHFPNIYTYTCICFFFQRFSMLHSFFQPRSMSLTSQNPHVNHVVPDYVNSAYFQIWYGALSLSTCSS